MSLPLLELLRSLALGRFLHWLSSGHRPCYPGIALPLSFHPPWIVFCSHFLSFRVRGEEGVRGGPESQASWLRGLVDELPGFQG